jgi:hypothetical protein
MNSKQQQTNNCADYISDLSVRFKVGSALSAKSPRKTKLLRSGKEKMKLTTAAPATPRKPYGGAI